MLIKNLRVYKEMKLLTIPIQLLYIACVYWIIILHAKTYAIKIMIIFIIVFKFKCFRLKIQWVFDTFEKKLMWFQIVNVIL